MCIHIRHCTYDACKYGEENCCPVYLGYDEPESNLNEDGFIYIIPNKEEFKKRRNIADTEYYPFS